MSSYTVEDALDRDALADVRAKLLAFNVAIAEARARKFEFVIANEPTPANAATDFLNYHSKIDVTGDLRVVATKRHGIAAPTPKPKPNEAASN